MRIRRTDGPAEGKEHVEEPLEGMTVKGLQWQLAKLTGHDTVEKDKTVLIRRITELRQKTAAATDLESMTTENLQRELNVLTTRRTLERDRAVLIRMITKIRQKKQEQVEAKAEAEIEAEATKPAATTSERLAALTTMNLGALREEYEKVFGKPSLSRNRKQLVKKIAEKIQADAATTEASTEPALKPTLTVKFERKRGKKAGGKGKGRSKAKAAAEGKETATSGRTTRQRDPRLPRIGTTIERIYKGKKLLVRVLEDGFEYQGKPYRSLSALAMAITGATAMNGYLFFHMGKYSKTEKAGQ